MSSVTKRFDVVAGRKYQTKQGEDKTHWLNCGEGAQWDDGGISIRLHTVPVGNWFDGSLKLFEKKDDKRPAQSSGNASAKGSAQQAPVAAQDDFEDSEIPF